VSKNVEAVNALRSMNADELDGYLRQQRRRLFEVRFQQAAGQVENHRQLREIRREIARTMTLQIELAHGHHLVSDLDLEVGEEPAEPVEVVEPVVKPRRRRAGRPAPELVEESQVEALAVEDSQPEDANDEGAHSLAEEGEDSPDDAGPDEGDE
jgi:large subunit ribosomal protein L29